MLSLLSEAKEDPVSEEDGQTTLYLRGMPERLVRETKVLAARRRMTLSALVAEALAQALGDEGVPAERASSNLQADVAWYDANKRRLLSRYRGQYLAIFGAKVIDHGREFGPLARRVFEKLGPRPVFMPRCVPGERIVKVPSPRVVRA